MAVKVDGREQDKKQVLKDKKWQAYSQTWVVYAKEMTDDFVVNTETGNLVGRKGDYLVWSSNGNRWPVAKDLFLKLYKKL